MIVVSYLLYKPIKALLYIFKKMFVYSFIGFSVPTVTEPTDDDDDSDWEDEDDSSEADDDGRVYKNPRNSPSTECPRNEEQATLLVKI